MQFKLTLNCANDAFAGDNLHHEIADLLVAAATRIRTGATDGRLYDTNGNPVGSFTVPERDEDESDDD